MPVLSTVATAVAKAYGFAGYRPSVLTDPYFNQVVLLLHGDGTNGAQNNTFLDGSTNNFTITRNGNTTQGTFSPFSLPDGQWSNYFDGTGDYLTAPANSAFEFAGDFTVECWIYPTLLTGNRRILSQGTSSIQNWIFYFENTTFYFYYNSSQFITSSIPLVLNSWQHIAVVRSGSTITIYQNGVSAGTATVSATVGNSAQGLTIGSKPTVDDFLGYISNVRIVKGTAVYTAAFTPPTTPLTAITNTSLLTCQDNRFIDNSTNAFAITRNGDVRVTAFSPFAPTAAYDAATNGGSGYFDGTGDYLTNTSNDMKTAMNFGTGDFTVEAWVYFTSSGNNQGIIDSATGLSTSALGQWFFYRDGSSKLQFGQHVGGAIATSTATLPVNAWTHVAVSRSGTSLKLFINGVEDGSATNSTNFNAAGSVQVGAVSTPLYLTGYLSNVRVVKGTAVYTAAFTPPTAHLTAITNTSLLLNFTNAGIIDASAKNDLETVGNAQIDTTTKKFGSGSLEFDGTGDYLVIPNSPNNDFGGGNWTIEFWVNFTAAPSSNVNYGIWTPVNHASGFKRLYISWYANQIYVEWFGTSVLGTSGLTWTTGQWYHIAIVRNGNSWTIYRDGTSQATTTNTNALDPASGYKIGESVNGFIDDFRVTKGVARYTANFTAPTRAFEDR